MGFVFFLNSGERIPSRLRHDGVREQDTKKVLDGIGWRVNLLNGRDGYNLKTDKGSETETCILADVRIGSLTGSLVWSGAEIQVSLHCFMQDVCDDQYHGN